RKPARSSFLAPLAGRGCRQAGEGPDPHQTCPYYPNLRPAVAVYTDITEDDLARFLTAYDAGTLTSYKGIAEGVENSNFLLHTTKGAFILTLYEKRVDPGDLPFFLGLMHHLAEKGLSCPLPLPRNDG